MYRIYLTTLVLVSTMHAQAADAHAIIPRPARMTVFDRESVYLDGISIVFAPAENADHRRGTYEVAAYLATEIEKLTGNRPAVAPAPIVRPRLPVFSLGTMDADEALGEEGYELLFEHAFITLKANTPHGLFNGVQTIRQLITRDAESGKYRVPYVHIIDKPTYPWRGSLLDCGRHFMTKDFIKRYIDLLAYHKMNVLHWHLTEDQGWRIEIKKYPKLTEVGAWRGDDRYGGFYTQDDIREIVAYAQSRYVTVVPEIEIPGHSQAALAAYPELSCTGGPFEVGTRWGIYPDVYCAGNDQTITFLEDVLTEVLELFPSEFIHIGGDECPKTRWQECPECQARIKAENLADEHELQSWVIRHFDRFLAERGRRLVGWDEILEGGLAPGATVQSWRGMQGAEAAAAAGHDVICSPTSNCYLDYAQARMPGEPIWMGYLPLERCYNFDPTPPEFTPEQAAHVLGIEGNMWTEHAPRERIDWQLYPRLCALAEVAWTPESHRDFDNFKIRLDTHYRRLDALGVQYFIPPPTCAADAVLDRVGGKVGVLDSPCNRRFEFTGESATATLATTIKHAQVRYTLDGSEPSAKSPAYTTPISLTATTVIRARTFLPTNRGSMIAEFRFSKLAPIAAVNIADLTPGLKYAYYEGQWEVLPDFATLKPLATGVAVVADTSVRQRDTQHALLFTGYLKVPADGTYTIHVTSDDGSRLWIHDELVIEHDGLHAASEESGRIALEAGLHPVRIEYFQAGGHSALTVSYEGPAIPKHQVPPEAWSH